MSIPLGFRYLQNMAIYPERSLGKAFIKDYGENLENHFDVAEKTLYKERVFCLDCLHYKTCRKFWEGCPYRTKALKIMRRES